MGREDLTGKVFGELTVLESSKDEKGHTAWKCKCSCGKIVYATTGHLKDGHTKSCGHLIKGRSGNKHPNFKGNEYKDYGDYLVGVDGKGREFIICKEDYDQCRLHRWSSSSETRKALGGFYFSARMSRKSPEGNKMKMLHTFVWELHNGKVPDGFRVDHIDQNPQNNRIDNLRLANKGENAMNNPVHSNNTSGIIGVSWDKREQSWRIYISYQKKRIELGHSRDKEEAIRRRLLAEKKYFKEFAPQKHLYKQYGIEADE